MLLCSSMESLDPIRHPGARHPTFSRAKSHNWVPPTQGGNLQFKRDFRSSHRFTRTPAVPFGPRPPSVPPLNGGVPFHVAAARRFAGRECFPPRTVARRSRRRHLNGFRNRMRGSRQRRRVGARTSALDLPVPEGIGRLGCGGTQTGKSGGGQPSGRGRSVSHASVTLPVAVPRETPQSHPEIRA